MTKLALTFIMVLMTCSLFSSSLAYLVPLPARLSKCPEPRPSPSALRGPFGCNKPTPPSHQSTVCIFYKDGSFKEQKGGSGFLCTCMDPNVDSVYNRRCGKEAELAKKKN